MKELNKIWTQNSACIIKKATENVKESGNIDDNTLAKVIINDLSCNYDSLFAEHQKTLARITKLESDLTYQRCKYCGHFYDD